MSNPTDMWAMLAIQKYVAELRDKGHSAASAGFCGMVIQESLEIPDIQNPADFEFFLDQLQTMNTHFDSATFNAAALTPMAVVIKLVTYKPAFPK